jgi:hypothetical protein
MAAPETRIFTAVRDQAWPPTASARKTCDGAQVQEIGKGLFGLGPIHVGPADDGNLGNVVPPTKIIGLSGCQKYGPDGTGSPPGWFSTDADSPAKRNGHRLTCPLYDPLERSAD